MSKNKPKKHSPHDFVFKQELGHGSYSTVYKALDKRDLKRVYAIKVCSKQHIIKENKVKYVTIEKNTLNLLAQGNHPGIIRLFYTFHDSENLYFVLDFAPGGELLSLLHKYHTFNEPWARHFTVQIIDSLEFIHSQNIIHRDLKPENILLNKYGKLLITDFGAATSVDSPCCTTASTSSSFVGTAEYVSPELLLYNQCGFSSDIWALGCMIFQFFTGKPPFRGENEMKTFEKIVALDYPWNTNSNIPITQELRLVRKILVIDPTKRLTLSQIKCDPWFQTVNWDDKISIWKGIWESQPQQDTNNAMLSRQLHVIDTPIRSIPITKQKNKKKPTKITQTTNSIVEWRKKLGISSYSDTNITPPVVRPPTRQPQFLETNHAPNKDIIKQNYVQIHEIPFNSAGPELSLQSYSRIDNDLITKLVGKHEKELTMGHSNQSTLLALFKDGTLSYTTVTNSSSTSQKMVNIGDSDLSMYDFEFDENNRQGFLILEKYKQKIWFLSLSNTVKQDFNTINNGEDWIDCFFKVRQMIEDEHLMNNLMANTGIGTERINFNGKTNIKPTVKCSTQKYEVMPTELKMKTNSTIKAPPKVPPPALPTTSPKKQNLSSDMIISSSRYEVLETLKRNRGTSNELENIKFYKSMDKNNINDRTNSYAHTKWVASSGASAAFKNLQKR